MSINAFLEEETRKFFLGTKYGSCPFCGKEVLLFLTREGIVSCRMCLNIICLILEKALNHSMKKDQILPMSNIIMSLKRENQDLDIGTI